MRKNGENIIIDNEHYNGRGNFSNLGNRMIDYIDNYNFVNRKISIKIGLGLSDAFACFVRYSKLQVIKETEQYKFFFQILPLILMIILMIYLIILL